MTVSVMETITIHFVSIFFMRVGLASEDMIVIRHIVMETYPAKDDGTTKDICIVGHAEPRRESGNPRLMNDKYMIAISKEAINKNLLRTIYAILFSEWRTDMCFRNFLCRFLGITGQRIKTH